MKHESLSDPEWWIVSDFELWRDPKSHIQDHIALSIVSRQQPLSRRMRQCGERRRVFFPGRHTLSPGSVAEHFSSKPAFALVDVLREFPTGHPYFAGAAGSGKY